MADSELPDILDDLDTGAVEAQAEEPQAFVREPKARITQPPIDDNLSYADEAGYAHDSDFTNDGVALSGKGYRKSRSDMNVLRRDLHYGQYLQIPKGRRDIFVSRERKTRLRTVVAVFLLLALLAAAAYFVVTYLQSQFG